MADGRTYRYCHKLYSRPIQFFKLKILKLMMKSDQLGCGAKTSTSQRLTIWLFWVIPIVFPTAPLQSTSYWLTPPTYVNTPHRWSSTYTYRDKFKINFSQNHCKPIKNDIDSHVAKEMNHESSCTANMCLTSELLLIIRFFLITPFWECYFILLMIL